MSNYNKILQAFKTHGYNDKSELSQGEINRVLDNLCNQNARITQFDRNVSAELWDQTSKQPAGTVALNEYIETIVKGINILQNQMEVTEKQIQRTKDEQQKQNLKQDLGSFSEDYKFLTLPFGIKPSYQSKMANESFVSATNRSISNSTVIFSKDPNQSGSSGTDLKVAFILNILLFCVELVLMFHKHHFFSLLAFLSIFAIYFLNYFDQTYMRFVLINLGVSILLDIVWMAVLANEYWYIKPETQHSTLHSGFLKFIVIFVAIWLILKLIMIGILFKYKNNTEDMRRKMSLLGMKFSMDGSPTGNLLTNVVQGKKENNFTD